MSWITQGLDKIVPQPELRSRQPAGPQAEQPEVGRQVLHKVLLSNLNLLTGALVFVLLSVRFSTQQQQQLQVRLRSAKGSFRRSLPQSGVSSAEPQLLPVKKEADPEDRSDHRPLPPTYVCVCVLVIL